MGVALIRRFCNVDSWLPVGLLAASLGLNLYLGWRINHTPSAGPALPSAGIVGEHAQPLVASDLRGGRVVVTWGGDSRPTILYVFAPDCAWCSRNLQSFVKLSERVAGYRIMGISLRTAGLTDYVLSNKFTFPVYASPSEETIRNFRLGATPETIIVSPEGVIQKAWLGVFTGRTLDEIEKTFGIEL